MPLRFSIVTLSLNQRAYLQEALDSVLHQDYPAVEYIVVDPGSTDGSRELIEQYRGRLAQVIFEPDHGAADGLNKGFSRATGDVFGFLNADDLLLPGALRKVADFLLPRPEYDLVMGNGFITSADGTPIRRAIATSFTPFTFLHGGASFLQQATFFRREAYLKAGGFNVNNRTCWDGELFLHMVLKGAKVGFLREDLAKFRLHQASITGSGRANAAFQADCARMFQQTYGRPRRWHDSLLGSLLRGRRLVQHPGQIVQAVRYRLARKA